MKIQAAEEPKLDGFLAPSVVVARHYVRFRVTLHSVWQFNDYLQRFDDPVRLSLSGIRVPMRGAGAEQPVVGYACLLGRRRM